MKTLLQHQIALSLVPGIGAISAKSLIAHCGSAEAVFRESTRSLLAIPGIHRRIVANVHKAELLDRAEKELKTIEARGIEVLYFEDKDYPRRLKHCDDAPILLYLKGDRAIFNRRIIAFVGSRAATEYGKSFCDKFIGELRVFEPMILSGLAYGIDIAAHKAALKYELPTAAVLGSGLDRIYPALHQSTVDKMLDSGGAIVTEFLCGTGPDRENFPKRNRIIAGISEAVVVVEAAIKGGALITAEIANTYNREVFAVPGRLSDPFSEGCNFLIRTNKAALLHSVADVKYLLDWEEMDTQSRQVSLFPDFNEDESQVYETLLRKKRTELDDLCHALNKPVRQVLPLLMTLELKGAVKSYPGRVYSSVG